MSDAHQRAKAGPPDAQFFAAFDPAVATAFACIVLLLAFGSFYSTSFLSPEYLLQQLKVASFLGVIATGMMIVILLGQIDLSVPWCGRHGRHDGLRGGSLRPDRRGAGDPVRHPVRHGHRPGERRRRCLSAHPLDDHHAWPPTPSRKG